MSSPVIPPPAFALPPDGLTYTGHIRRRCLDLIEKGIWSGLQPVKLLRWMRNFNGELERYFAACVLDALMYRSDDQTTALVVQLFQRSLVDLERRDPSPVPGAEDWLVRLQGTSEPMIRLVAAVGRNDPPHKSGHLVTRMMKRQLSVNPRWLIMPNQVADTANRQAAVLIFVDDFLGTGDQFKELLQTEELDWVFQQKYVIYAPFAAHVRGRDALRDAYPQLRVVAAETLDAGHELFNADAHFFDDGVNTPQGARAFYSELLERKGLVLREPIKFGYGQMSLSYVFEQAVPDNNLPLLWHPPEGDWEPLFSR